MIDPEKTYLEVIKLLDENQVSYKLFSHKAALTYEDLAQAQKETGFFGTEGKCMVIKVDDKFIVYATLQGRRLNFDAIKNALHANKLRLASPEELKEYFGAEPGCAYPFGFSKDIDIFINPEIYKQEWLLFSPVLPTKTVQAKGEDLERVFDNLPNKVTEVTYFNQ
ncbi:YbaK/EbsC family protein [Candidatus Daviesbacteria bacterium]|nr:YbaK/EbsC family protein [Candidatus Daviesbacteria bacterium]